MRERLRERARRHDLVLIEDDAYADILFRGQPGRPLFADAPQACFYIGTFSKSLCPGLRVGWLVAPRRFREPALEVKRESDLQANSLAQTILEAFFQQQDFDARIGATCRRYRRRAARLAEALRRYLPEWSFQEPEGGFSIWVDTGEPGDDVAFLELAVASGTSFDPGIVFRASEPSTLCLRLCYSCLDEACLEEGVKRLRGAWRSWLRHGKSQSSSARRPVAGSGGGTPVHQARR